MANERNWLAVPAQLLLVNGGAYGEIRVPSTVGIKVKQKVRLFSNTLPKKDFEVKAVLDETDLILGPQSPSMEDTSNLQAYTTADSASLESPKQLRPSILPDIYNRSVFEEEPAVAIRSFLVDHLGRRWHKGNPFASQIIFTRNGAPQEVLEDLVDPSNNRPLPVKLTGVQGDVIIEADNLNLQVQSEGEYHAVDNPKPDSIGLVSHERGLTQDRTKQVRRITAKRGTVDTDTVSQDVSIHDHDGNSFGLENPLNVRPTPFVLDVARSKYPTFQKIDIVGKNDDIDTANAEDIWSFGGTYPFPVSAQTVTLSSSSISDNGVTPDSGARSVFIVGLDSNYDEVSETILLNGTTNVVTTNSFLRINRVYVVTTGASGTNKGNIQGRHGATVLFQIDSEVGDSQLGIFTVPAGKTAYIESMHGSVIPSSGASGLKEGELVVSATSEDNNIFVRKKVIGLSSQATAPFSLSMGWLRIQEKSDIKLRFVSNDNNSRVTAGMVIILEDN